MMGSPATELGRRDVESPQHQVTVPTFFSGKYPITQAQWQAVMGNNPSYFKGEKHPVGSVSWEDAVKFCSKLSQKTGSKYRLLSEAEWEYACRARTTTPFHFGATITTELGNFNRDSPYTTVPKGSCRARLISEGLYRQRTTEVGSFPPNAFGLYDMHGNVWEWCSDGCHHNYNSAPTDGSSWETGPSESRVQRGGSCYTFAVHCRAANRSCGSAGGSDRNGGFRVAVALAVPSSLSSL